MKPTNVEILRAVIANIEELMAPCLKTPHARSAAVNARMLLQHVILRIEGEGQMLATDNAEKRAMLHDLAQQAADLPVPEALASMLMSQLEAIEAIAAYGEYTSIDALAAENEALKRLTNDVLLEIHGRADLPEESFERLRAPLRRQLRAQIDRELALVTTALTEPIFPNAEAEPTRATSAAVRRPWRSEAGAGPESNRKG